MSAECLLCGRPAPLRFWAGDYAIHRCERCDFEFVFPPPTPEAIARVYERGYFSGEGHGYADYFERERRSNRRKAEQRLDRLTELGLASGARLLDVGCADGTFVEAALARGFDPYGIEVSPEALARLPAALQGRVYPSLSAAAGTPYDAITMWDVLEHLTQPVATLREAVSLMRDGALFGIVVPVIDNFNARHWPQTWDQYKPPEHLSFFSCASLRALFEREVGELLLEEPAWRRESRFLDVAAHAPRVFRALVAADAAVTRALVGRGVLPETWTEDSVALYARRGPTERGESRR
jgi:SAM-dependent methyltransferase